jgi:glycosyltransferase involved in cell wall biosynthesis
VIESGPDLLGTTREIPARSGDLSFGTEKLTVIVPVFNEAPRILENLALLTSEIGRHFTNYEVICISDGSTDQTAQKILSLVHPNVRVVVNAKNSGKGSVVRKGFQLATGDYVLFIDGGMEIHPKEIRVFVGLISIYDCDVVIGSKRHPQSRVGYPVHRRILSWMFQRLVRVLFRLDVTDTQVGIKLFRADVVKAILPHLEINRYGFDLELLSLATRFGYGRILEAPIEMDYFGTNERNPIREYFHVFKIACSLAKDTFKLWSRLRVYEYLPRPSEPTAGRRDVRLMQ